MSFTVFKNPGFVMRLIARILFALCLFGVGNASTASVAEGEAAYNRTEYRQARDILEPYALAGNMQAQFLLGRMYANGEGVLQDYVRAHAWLNLAALYGHSEARTLRDRISPRMTPTQLAQAQSDARQFQPVPLPAPTRKKTASSSNSQGSEQASVPARRSDGKRQTIRDIQTYLSELGYDPGPADGLMGRRTRAAIRAYQSHSGLPENGQPSAELRLALAIDLGYADPAPLANSDASEAASSVPSSSQSTASVATQPAFSNPDAPSPAPVPSATQSNEPVYVREARQSGASTPQTSTPSTRSASQGGGGFRGVERSLPTESAIAELRDIVAEAERTGQADYRFITSLNRLVDRHSKQKRNIIAFDDFADGEFKANPRWQVESGRFWVSPGEGLRTQVETVNTQQAAIGSSSSNGDVGAALLSAILSEIAKGSSRGSNSRAAPVKATPAEIWLPANIPSNFSVTTKVLSGDPSGHLELGVFTERNLRIGYHVMYVGTQRRHLRLVRRSRSGEVTLDYFDQNVRFEDGQAHTLTLARDSRARITVTLDGQPVMSAVDYNFKSGFQGFTLINEGGNYAFKSVAISH